LGGGHHAWGRRADVGRRRAGEGCERGRRTGVAAVQRVVAYTGREVHCRLFKGVIELDDLLALAVVGSGG
jgi:hypothetical protein